MAAIWFLGVSIPLTILHSTHWISIPLLPTGEQKFSESDAVRTIHVLDPRCLCSGELASYLIRRGARPGWPEEVWLLGRQPEWSRDLSAKGFTVRSETPESVEHSLGLQGVPALVVLKKDGTVAYLGGYSTRPVRQGAEYLDLSIRDQVAEGHTVAALPIFGCASSKKLREALDPINIKYTEP